MGYYTRYTLEFSPQNVSVQAALNRPLPSSPAWTYLDATNGEGCSQWRDVDADMRSLSRACPGVLFKLHGVGEETGDVWSAYYQDGKGQMCKAELVIPEFDPRKMS